MEHIAVMDPSLGMIPKIVSGEKDVESRWYMRRKAPWDRVREGDVVYFKNVGEPVTVRAEVSFVLQYSLYEANRREIIREYGTRLGVDSRFLEQVRDRRYCILMGLVNVVEIEPFGIDRRRGRFAFGDAWLVLNGRKIEDVKKCTL